VAGVLILWLILGPLVGWAIGNPKGRGVEGAGLGFLLGVIGWIIVAVMSPTPEAEAQRARALAAALDVTPTGIGPPIGRQCPWCAETIKPAARVCRFCGRDVEPIAPETIVEDEMARVQAEYPEQYSAARVYARPADSAAVRESVAPGVVQANGRRVTAEGSGDAYPFGLGRPSS
jgi:hypothetical protein